MRTGAATAASAVDARRHNQNDVTITIAGLWRYGDWLRVTTGCTGLLFLKKDLPSLFLRFFGRPFVMAG